jgi:hypothetical protein
VIALALEVTGRYPYFLQELGSAVWAEAADQTVHLSDVENTSVTVENKLDDSFFEFDSTAQPNSNAPIFVPWSSWGRILNSRAMLL